MEVMQEWMPRGVVLGLAHNCIPLWWVYCSPALDFKGTNRMDMCVYMCACGVTDRIFQISPPLL